MDLRAYYRKVRETAEQIAEDFVVVVSEETPERGKAGVKTEVTRSNAAKMIADGRARLATDAETASFHEENRKALERLQREEAARHLQVMVVPRHDLKKIEAKDGD